MLFVILAALVAGGLFLILRSGGTNAATPPRGNALAPSSWQIGPILDGVNRSVGMPLHPLPHPEGGWHFDFPPPSGHVHYVTFNHGPLAGKSRIVMRYRIEADPGVEIRPRQAPEMPEASTLSLYFQRKGDDWTGKGKYDFFRMYAYSTREQPIDIRERDIVVELRPENFIGVWGTTPDPQAFREAVANCESVGMVFGGGGGLGHGVFATGPARFVLKQFLVE